MDRLLAWWATWSSGTRAAPAVDTVFALALGGLAALGSWDAAADHGLRLGPGGFALIAVAGAGLTVRRRRPVIALGTTLAATMAYLALGYPYSPILQLVAVAAYSVGAWCTGRVSLAVTLVSVGVYVPFGWWRNVPPWPGLATVPLALAWLILPWLVGLAVRGHRRVRARMAEAERQGHVYRERLRIAQDVHDIIGHSLAVINMQAGVALHVLDRRPQSAAEVLRNVREISADALTELRGALGRADAFAGAASEQGGARGPAPGLQRLPELVQATSHDGLFVDLIVRGRRPALPAAVDLAGYRIVQEALTNVIRHAGASRATVEVAYGEFDVSVTITDNGRAPATIHEGRGLVGMRERVTATGGTFTAGPGPSGGFRVRAALPVRAEVTHGRYGDPAGRRG